MSGAEPNGQVIGDAAAEAESGGADLAGAVGARLQPVRRGNEILEHLLAIDLHEKQAAVVVVAGKAAEGGESVGREGHEVGHGEAARDVFDVGVQAAVFVDDDDAGQLRGLGVSRVRTDRADEISFDAAIAFWRGNGLVAGFDAVIVRGQFVGPRRSRASTPR